MLRNCLGRSLLPVWQFNCAMQTNIWRDQTFTRSYASESEPKSANTYYNSTKTPRKSTKKDKKKPYRPPKKTRLLKKEMRQTQDNDEDVEVSPYDYAKVLRKEKAQKEEQEKKDKKLKKDTSLTSTMKIDAKKIKENNRVRKSGVAGENFQKIKWWRIAPSDDGLRLDRFIQLQCPYLAFGISNQLMRKEKITIGNRQTRESSTLLSGKELKGSRRLLPGEYVHINFDCIQEKKSSASKAERLRHHISTEQISNFRSLVIYKDPYFLAINKPSGMPVQGDGLDVVSMLPYLQEFGDDCATEIPRLVHRLDKDTSGVLLLARTRKAAVHLGALFRTKGLVLKRYWAVVSNRVRPKEGKIRMALKRITKGGSDYRVGVTEHDDDAVMAISQYYTLNVTGKYTLLGLEPITGKTHQLRVHCATALNAPILGDTKYFPRDVDQPTKDQITSLTEGDSPLHLHAKQIQFVGANNKIITISAPLPPHMKVTFANLGWNLKEVESLDLTLNEKSLEFKNTELTKQFH